MNRGLKIIIAALVVGTEAVIAAAITPAAIETGFRSQVTMSEDCRGGYSNCRQGLCGVHLCRWSGLPLRTHA